MGREIKENKIGESGAKRKMFPSANPGDGIGCMYGWTARWMDGWMGRGMDGWAEG